jgi:hypothetical protein
LNDAVFFIFLPSVRAVSCLLSVSGNVTYLYAIFIDELSPVQQLSGLVNTSMVEMIPKSPGSYQLVTNFTSTNNTTLYLGVITNNVTFYGSSATYYDLGSGSYFVILNPVLSLPPGKGTISLKLEVVKPGGGSTNPFQLVLPPFSKLLFVSVLIGMLVYWNSYIVVDTYFLGKNEQLSNRRKILVAVSIALSCLVVFLYAFG